MALFQRKKKEEAVENKEGQAVAETIARDTAFGGHLSDVLRNPRITEKATAHSALGVYAFDVSDNATKRSVASAVARIYKVMPRKIRIVSTPAKVKRSVRTGARGISGGGKKAYVYLKKGDTITIA